MESALLPLHGANIRYYLIGRSNPLENWHMTTTTSPTALAAQPCCVSIGQLAGPNPTVQNRTAGLCSHKRGN